MNVLETIVAAKKQEVSRRKKTRPLAELEQQPLFHRPVLSARQALAAAASTGIIAEFKRKSPSKGVINDRVGVEQTTVGYVEAGAACLSVLTDEPFFGGTLTDLVAARQVNPSTPLLRKDFVIDTYQIAEARSAGADFILLIAACLQPTQVEEFSQYAHQLGLEVLLEVHDNHELESHLTGSVDLVGVNNRSLKTFITDIQVSHRLVSQIPAQYVRVSESGLQHPQTIFDLRQAGYQGFLIGETFMKTQSPPTALRELVRELSRLNTSSQTPIYDESESMRNA